MSDQISSELVLSKEGGLRLDALLDTLLPRSADGTMISGADVAFLSYVREQAPEQGETLRRFLADLPANFQELTLEARVAVVAEQSQTDPDAFKSLLTRVYDCYYQDDRVRAAIGAVGGAPFPQGNEVVSGDLALLDPVVARSDQHRYRPTD